mgnify:CR=1 FL=1
MKIYVAVIIVALMALLIGLQVRKPAATTKTSVEHIVPTVEVREAEVEMGESSPWGAREVKAQVTSSETAPNPEQAIEPRENMVTATAIIARADGSRLELSAIDQEFERVTLLPGESIRVQVDIANAEPGKAVTLETGHGGNINGTMGLATVMPRDGRIEFTFSAGGHRGKYPVFIYQGSRQELMDFRVGPEPPLGKAGPARNYGRSDS